MATRAASEGEAIIVRRHPAARVAKWTGIGLLGLLLLVAVGGALVAVAVEEEARAVVLPFVVLPRGRRGILRDLHAAHRVDNRLRRAFSRPGSHS